MIPATLGNGTSSLRELIRTWVLCWLLRPTSTDIMAVRASEDTALQTACIRLWRAKKGNLSLLRPQQSSILTRSNILATLQNHDSHDSAEKATGSKARGGQREARKGSEPGALQDRAAGVRRRDEDSANPILAGGPDAKKSCPSARGSASATRTTSR